MWHGTIMLAGLRTEGYVRKVNVLRRRVLFFSAGTYELRKWLHDFVFAEGRDQPAGRPLHKWQQAMAPVHHWVRKVSEPGELVVGPFFGLGTTAVVAVFEGQRFLGSDIDAGSVETTQRRLVELEEEPASLGELPLWEMQRDPARVARVV